jgi:hypothetical protein
MVNLIVHQGNQRREHYQGAGHYQRRELKTKGFAGRGMKGSAHIATRGVCVNDCALVCAPPGKSENTCQNRVNVESRQLNVGNR